MTLMRRTRSGAVDTEHYLQQAHRLRACFVRQIWRRLYADSADFLRGITNNGWAGRGIKRWSRCEN